MEPKRSQAIGIFITSLHLSAADIETALLSFDASLLPLETLQSLFEHVSAVSEHGGGACEGGGGQAMTRVSLRFGVATLLQCGDCLLTVTPLEVPLGLSHSSCAVSVFCMSTV